MKLVWHADNLLEADWLRAMFGDLVDEEIIDLELTCFDDETIHVVSRNWAALATYEAYFRECRARCKHLVLFHASDEWFSGSYRLYRHFDVVIRNFRTYLADDGVILTIPEGYPNGTPVGAPSVPADQRGYAWSFIGEFKASRLAMVAAFDGLQPQYVADTRVDKMTKDAFNAVLGNSVFSPCPMGNVIVETWRLYESLELGCIPLVENRVSLKYYDSLFGPNPIPAFRGWAQARHYAETTLPDKPGLLARQTELHVWWAGYKQRVRAQVRDAVTGPSRTAALQRYGERLRNRFPVLYEPLRLTELLRHQSADSLRRRLANPVGPLKRIFSETLGSDRPRDG